MITPTRSDYPLRRGLASLLTAFLRSTPSLLAICCCLLITACKTSGKVPTNHMAAVQIDNRSQDIIYTAVREVFDEEGFAGVGTEAGNLIFEKKGGAKETILYGTWFNSSVWLRVKLRARPISLDNYILEANAYMIQDKGEMFFETEQKAHHSARSKLQKTLVQIKEMLQ